MRDCNVFDSAADMAVVRRPAQSMLVFLRVYQEPSRRTFKQREPPFRPEASDALYHAPSPIRAAHRDNILRLRAFF